jgi:hypothetical protein
MPESRRKFDQDFYGVRSPTGSGDWAADRANCEGLGNQRGHLD